LCGRSRSSSTRPPRDDGEENALPTTKVRRQQQQQPESQLQPPLHTTLTTRPHHDAAENDGRDDANDESSSSSSSSPPIHVYVLAGQSNMVGYGSVEHLRLLLEHQQQQKQQQQQQQPRNEENNNNNIRKQKYVESTPYFTGCGFADHQHLWNANDDNRSWRVLDRVTVVSPGNPYRQPLSVGLGKNASYFGPELGFAWALLSNQAYGVFNDDDNDIVHNDDTTIAAKTGVTRQKTRPPEIVLIKTAWNEKSLAVDFRPPSAGNGTFLNYKGDPIPTFRYGEYYRAMKRMVHETIYNLTTTQKIVEHGAAAGRNDDNKQQTRRRSVEIKGFVWFQGWSDQNEDRRMEYASNLAHLIRDVRRDVFNIKKFDLDDDGNKGSGGGTMMNNNNNNTPTAVIHIPVIVGETGQLVSKKKPRQRRHIEQIRQAQEAVTLQPEFCASTQFVRTHHLVHDGSGGDGGGFLNMDLFARRYSNTFHFSGHADTVYAIGCAMGEAMLKLQQEQQRQHGNSNGNTPDNRSCAVGETALQR
jgi:Carbohydrate esterase, sialic acid-specific acetylesterase